MDGHRNHHQTSKYLLISVVVIGIVGMFLGIFRESKPNAIVYGLMFVCCVINRIDSRSKGRIKFSLTAPGGAGATLERFSENEGNEKHDGGTCKNSGNVHGKQSRFD
jgi:hypothetical protein